MLFFINGAIVSRESDLKFFLEQKQRCIRMMDVKNTINGSAASITTMVGRAAVEKNHEQKVLMEKPIREDEPKKVSSVEETSNQSSNATTDEDISQPMPTTGKMVDVNI